MRKLAFFLPLFLCFILTLSAFGISPFRELATGFPTGSCLVTTDPYRVEVRHYTSLYDYTFVLGCNVTIKEFFYGSHWHGADLGNGTYTFAFGTSFYAYLWVEKEAWNNCSEMITIAVGGRIIISLTEYVIGTPETGFHLVESSGDWDYYSDYPDYLAPNMNVANQFARYEATFTSFLGLSVNVTAGVPFDASYGIQDLLTFHTMENRYTILNITLGNSSYWVSEEILFDRRTELLGQGNGEFWVSGYLCENSSFARDDNGYKGVKQFNESDTLSFYIDVLNNSAVRFLGIDYYSGYSPPEQLNDQTALLPSGFLNDMNLTLEVTVGGSAGQSDLYLNWTFGAVTPPLYGIDYVNTFNIDDPFPRWISGFTKLVYGILPASVRSFIDTLGTWLTPIWGVLGAVWGMFITLIPFAPFILLFYFLDAIWTSISVGSIQPVGVVITTVWSLGVGLVSTIVQIGETIWSFIKFW